MVAVLQFLKGNRQTLMLNLPLMEKFKSRFDHLVRRFENAGGDLAFDKLLLRRRQFVGHGPLLPVALVTVLPF